MAYIKGLLKTSTGDVMHAETDATMVKYGYSTISAALGTAESTITTLSSDLDTAEGNIATLTTDLDTAEGNIATLTTDLDAAEGNISTLTTSLGTVTETVSEHTTSIATLQAAVAGRTRMTIVDDITDRDALTPVEGDMALVLDASSDETVGSGAATYVYRAEGTAWIKIAEYESMDISSIAWSSITGKEVDAAVVSNGAGAPSNLATGGFYFEQAAAV